MELENFLLPTKNISATFEKKYIGDAKLKRQSPWIYEAMYDTSNRIEQIKTLANECCFEGIEIEIQHHENGFTIIKDGFKPLDINPDDEDIENIVKHATYRLYALLNPEEQANNLIGNQIDDIDNSLVRGFSYIEFALEQIDASNTACTPSQMIRAAINSGAPHKGDKLEDNIREACETIAGRSGYCREQTKSSGYAYKKVEVAPEQLNWF